MIVTHNVRDFEGVEDVEDSFGITIVTPREFLLQLEGTEQ